MTFKHALSLSRFVRYSLIFGKDFDLPPQEPISPERRAQGEKEFDDWILW